MDSQQRQFPNLYPPERKLRQQEQLHPLQLQLPFPPLPHPSEGAPWSPTPELKRGSKSPKR
ncbi:hypothetical protein D3C83_38230 [compost metagenome]